ncbi:MAG: hypothetical protein ACI85I_000487 [Arenicella sp.]|jgi:uncharacterized protein (TIGR01777 family)
MKVLITGGTGLVGTRMTDFLLEKGYEVAYLSRSKKQDGKVQYYQWNTEKQFIEEGAIETADYIIHLAGAGVADERWTPSRKKMLMESRTHTTELLYQKLSELKHNVKAFISATAIGIYGDSGEQLVNEDSPHANDFLAQICTAWEDKADKIKELGIRTPKIRVGVVLSEKGGALKEISKPIKLYAGAPLGSGKQLMSWIHIDDIANLFIHAMENESMNETYNGVAPNPISNEQLTKIAAEVLDKPLILPNVPEFALKLMLGEMAEVVLMGSNVSSEKTQSTGFAYKFTDAKKAVEDLMG